MVELASTTFSLQGNCTTNCATPANGGYDGNRTHVFLRDKETGLNHCPTQPNLNFVFEISNSCFSTLVQNRTGTAGLEDPCTLRYATRVF